MTERIDWWQVVTDLQRAGYSHDRIAAECLRGKTWVWSLQNIPNTEPRFHDGMLLLGLWADATRSDRADPPRLLPIVGKANA